MAPAPQEPHDLRSAHVAEIKLLSVLLLGLCTLPVVLQWQVLHTMHRAKAQAGVNASVPVPPGSSLVYGRQEPAAREAALMAILGDGLLGSVIMVRGWVLPACLLPASPLRESPPPLYLCSSLLPSAPSQQWQGALSYRGVATWCWQRC